MLTKKLNQAYKMVNQLVDFLVEREWDDSPELCSILEQANNKIERIQDKAIADVLVKLQGSYSEEAIMWANNKMTDMSGEACLINKAEQAKAKTELKRIQNTISKLSEFNSS